MFLYIGYRFETEFRCVTILVGLSKYTFKEDIIVHYKEKLYRSPQRKVF